MLKTILTMALLASAAQADMIKQTTFIDNWANPLSQWTSTVSLPFQQFDPTLGQLTGVQFQASSDIGMYFATWPADSPDFLIMQDTLSTARGSAYRSFTYGTLPGAPPRPVDTSMRVAESGSMDGDLTSFIGSNSWSFNVTGDVWLYLKDPYSAPLPPGALSLRNLSVEMDYVYTPTFATAEPRYAGLLLIGIAILGWVARRTWTQVRVTGLTQGASR